MKVFQYIKPFEDFLNTLTRFDPNDIGYQSKIAVPKKSWSFPNNDEYFKPEQLIWFKSDGSFSMMSAHRILEKALRISKHVYSEEIIDSILLLFTYLPNRKNGNIIQLDDLFQKIQTVTLSQFHFLPSKLVDDLNFIRFGRFKIGKIDEKKFEYRCKKATSDYYELYKENINNRAVVERDYFDTNIIVWQNMFDRHFLKPSTFEDHLLNFYENVSNLLFGEFWDLFIEDQTLLIALGVDYIDDKIFRNVLTYENVSIYTNIEAFDRNVGYVVPERRGIKGVNFRFRLNDIIKETNDRLRKEYSFDKYNNSDIHNTIHSFVKYNAKAYIYLYENKIDDAFLHFVISLDLLLGDEGANTKTVSRRTALLTFKTFNTTFLLQMKTVSDIYSVRSKYVHQGKSVNAELLETLKQICRSILGALLKIQANPKYQVSGFIVIWMRELDYVASALEAGKEIVDEELIQMGILN